MMRLARRAAADPHRFVRFCFTDPSGRPLAPAAVHAELHAFLTDHPKALVELPRDHGKTTQVCGRIVWELGRHPGLRVKLVCGTDALAADRGRFVQRAVADNRRVRLVFPHLRPSRPWAARSFTVRRPAEAVGPSVSAVGVGTGSTGSRADLLVCDDVVDVKAVHSRADRDRVAHLLTDNLLNLLEPDGRLWVLFTPWHADDAHARLKRNPAFAHFRRAVGADLQPVWPARWPVARLRERRAEIGSAAFARGYRLTPVAEDEVPIRREWVRTWTPDGREPEMVLLSVDPAVGRTPGADRSAMVVLGAVRTGDGRDPSPQPPPRSGEGEPDTDPVLPATSLVAPPRLGEGLGRGCSGREFRVLAAVARRVPAPELVTLLDLFDQQFAPDVILFENNAAFEGLRAVLAGHARFGPKLKGVTQTRSKAARAAGFAVAVETGGVRLRADERGEIDVGQRELFEEMTSFPFGEHDDLLDAAATGTAYLLAHPTGRLMWG